MTDLQLAMIGIGAVLVGGVFAYNTLQERRARGKAERAFGERPGDALFESPDLKDFSGRVSDSGEGRWTIQAAIEQGTPADVLTSALYQRFSSRGEAEFQNKLLSALRFQFGGHHEKPST